MSFKAPGTKNSLRRRSGERAREKREKEAEEEEERQLSEFLRVSNRWFGRRFRRNFRQISTLFRKIRSRNGAFDGRMHGAAAEEEQSDARPEQQSVGQEGHRRPTRTLPSVVGDAAGPVVVVVPELLDASGHHRRRPGGDRRRGPRRPETVEPRVRRPVEAYHRRAGTLSSSAERPSARLAGHPAAVREADERGTGGVRARLHGRTVRDPSETAEQLRGARLSGRAPRCRGDPIADGPHPSITVCSAHRRRDCRRRALSTVGAGQPGESVVSRECDDHRGFWTAAEQIVARDAEKGLVSDDGERVSARWRLTAQLSSRADCSEQHASAVADRHDQPGAHQAGAQAREEPACCPEVQNSQA